MKFKRWLQAKGASLVEYGMLVGLVTLLAIGSVRTFGKDVDFQYAISALELYVLIDDLSNYLVNGDFDDVSDLSSTGWGFLAPTIDGWEEVSGYNLPFELHTSGWDNMESVNGGYWLDTNASPGRLRITQVVQDLEPRQVYKITLFAGDRDSDLDGSADVFWGGEKIGVLDPDVEDVMQSFTFYIQEGAGDGSNRLIIQDTGSNDNSGLSLDVIRIYGPD